MPYIPWVPSEPLGSAQANTIDDIIRQLKAQIEERMNTILDPTGQWDDDPIKLSGTATLRTGLKVLVGPYGLVVTSAGFATDVDGKYVQITGGNNNAHLNIPAVKGWKLVTVKALVDPNGNSVSWTTRRTTFVDPTPVMTVIHTGNATGGPLVATINLINPASPEIVDNSYYTTDFDGTGAWNFYGAAVTYDEV